MWSRAIVLTVAAACALVACGDDDGEKGGDEQQIRAVLEEALTTTDPDACTRLATQRFVEQVTGERGRDALRDCRKDAGRAAAKSSTIGRVAVSGPRASADVQPRGGSLTFKTARFGLRKFGDDWKLDRLKSGILDRAAFFAYGRKILTREPDAATAAEADCVLRDLKDVKDGAIVRAMLRSDPRLIIIPAFICGIRSSLGDDVPDRLLACVTRRVRRELTTGPTGREMAADPSNADDVLEARGEQAARTALRCPGASGAIEI